MAKPVPVRMPLHLVDSVDRLAADMADAHRPEAACAGVRWGRSALIRLLVARGTVELRRELSMDLSEAGCDGE